MSPVNGPGGIDQIIAMRREIVERNEALKSLGSGNPATDQATPAGVDFSATLGEAVQQVNATQARARDLAAAYERGEVTDIAQVMLARQESGIAFEATLQVRNKLLTAYQEIMRMGG